MISMADKQKESSVTETREPILVISGLHKRYCEGKSNEVHAIRGLDLTVRKGDMMAIMGPSGCGKTTLLNMIGHLDHHSEGKIVIDGSSRVQNGTILIKEPIILKIKNGNIAEIAGSKEAKELENTLNWAASIAKHPGSIRRICELGIGLNPKAKIIGATLVDDKALGTAHVGIGSNYWFGGNIYAIIHLDQVFRNPRIYFDGKLVEI